jgi:hypothetical protein
MKVNEYEKVSDFSQPFVPHGVACPRFAFQDVGDDETSVLECFEKFSDEDTWHLFAEQTNTSCYPKFPRI